MLHKCRTYLCVIAAFLLGLGSVLGSSGGSLVQYGNHRSMDRDSSLYLGGIETVYAEDILEIQSPSVILLEPQTGQILYEKNADERRHPASVTKVMTLLLTFEQIGSGKMSLNDVVTVSEHAASMGGSQCFFEPGETQTVEDMIKCIVIASGNDAAVAMGEHIAGSEEAFVQKMNEKAAELGMENTHFENACGLDAENHLTTARDIAIMSRELITKYPAVFDYSGIWMDTITHVTRRGESEFGLSNTNKLLKAYPYCTGLKTGYTSEAGFSISATAERDGIGLLAVVMGAPTKDIRNSEVCKLFDYGFANCTLYQDAAVLEDAVVCPVQGGRQDTVTVIPEKNSYTYLMTAGQTAEQITKECRFSELTAPIQEGDVIGEAVYYYDGERIGAVPLLAGESVDAKTYGSSMMKAVLRFFLLVEPLEDEDTESIDNPATESTDNSATESMDSPDTESTDDSDAVVDEIEGVI